MASTVISTSASAIERHRIERIGGEMICESALTAASSMVVLPLTKTLARGSYPGNVRQGREDRALRLRHNTGPAGDSAAYRAPSAKALVDLGRNLRLLLQRALGLYLGIRDVSDGEPAWGVLVHLLGDQAEDRIAHFGDVAQSLQLVMIV